MAKVSNDSHWNDEPIVEDAQKGRVFFYGTNALRLLEEMRKKK